MRIASLLPSATETLLSLGAGGELACITHRCPQPAGREVPVVTVDAFAGSAYTQKEIAIFLRMLGQHTAQGIVAVDQDALAGCAPEIVFMQGSCDLCAAPGTQPGEGVLTDLPGTPRVITLQPHSLGEVLADIRRVGQAIGRAPEAEAVLGDLRARMMRVMREAMMRFARAGRKRVAFLEWVDPVMAGGFWLPELVEAAGGLAVVGARQVPASATPWAEIVAAQPDVILVSLPGLTVEWAAGEIDALRRRAEWSELPAVRAGEVYVLDGTRHFHMPDARIIDSLELLAAVLYPDAFGFPADEGAVRRLDAAELGNSEGP